AVQAVLIGEGPLGAPIEREILRRNLSEHVRLIGWSRQVVSWLKTADLLLFPSLTEGSSNVVLEAMACSCPIVASNIDSCIELLGEDRGVLCPPRDAGAFVDAILGVFH